LIGRVIGERMTGILGRKVVKSHIANKIMVIDFTALPKTSRFLNT
jgi:hypothetical protein